MGHALAVYSVAALLLVAGSGPALKAMRDASLGEFEDLGKFRSLEEFPFLEEVRPYLPPLVVDWIIVQRHAPGDLPEGVDYRFDDDGRVVLIWPDGCEETEERWREESACAPPDGPDCDLEPGAAGCDPCVVDRNATDCEPPDCPPGHVLSPAWPDADPACVPDPECEGPDENGTRPAHCPPPAPPADPECPADTIEAYDGACVPVATMKLKHYVFQDEKDQRALDLELKVPYENLSIMVDFSGIPSPGYTIKLFTVAGTRVCFLTNDADDGDDCDPRRQSGRNIGAGDARYDTTGSVAADNLTFLVEFDPHEAAGASTLEVRLYGRPAEAPDDDE